jgi:hypothetical protein
MTFVVCYYGYIVPWANPIIIIAFIIQYWVDKYNAFRRYSAPYDLVFEYSERVLCLFEISLIFFSLSHFLWDLDIHYDATLEIRLLNIFGLVLATLYVVINFLRIPNYTPLKKTEHEHNNSA